MSNPGFGGTSNFGGASSSFGGESCNRLSDCQFDRSSILDKPKITPRSVLDTYKKCAMKILEWKVRDIDLVDSARELQAAVLTLAQTMLKQV